MNVNKICDVLDGHQRQLLKDIAILDQMYAQNLNYFKELTMYILAGKKKLELVRSTELRDLQNKAQMTGKAEDAQAAKDLEDLCNRFEKKLYDLELTADPHASEQRFCNGRKDPIHTRQHHSALEKPDDHCTRRSSLD